MNLIQKIQAPQMKAGPIGFKVGDTVKEGEDLVELTTEKASFNLPSPVSGTVKQVIVGEGDKVKVGQTLATIE